MMQVPWTLPQRSRLTWVMVSWRWSPGNTYTPLWMLYGSKSDPEPLYLYKFRTSRFRETFFALEPLTRQFLKYSHLRNISLYAQGAKQNLMSSG